MNSCIKQIHNGIIKENPIFVLMLGMCPTLAVTTSAINGLGMGITTTCVLILSNTMISLLKNIIPKTLRVPSFIVVIASFVSIAEFLLEAYIPSLYDSLGIYIPLIVVNCIVLGRAESFASKNKVLVSAFDGLGMGLGFTIGLTSIAIVRELLGSGTIFGIHCLPSIFEPISILSLAPGAFFVVGSLCAIINLKNKKKVGHDCGSCTKECSARRDI